MIQLKVLIRETVRIEEIDMLLVVFFFFFFWSFIL